MDAIYLQPHAGNMRWTAIFAVILAVSAGALASRDLKQGG